MKIDVLLSFLCWSILWQVLKGWLTLIPVIWTSCSLMLQRDKDNKSVTFRPVLCWKQWCMGSQMPCMNRFLKRWRLGQWRAHILGESTTFLHVCLKLTKPEVLLSLFYWRRVNFVTRSIEPCIVHLNRHCEQRSPSTEINSGEKNIWSKTFAGAIRSMLAHPVRSVSVFHD